jgi:polyisoprenoid-binding protein YceI
MESGAYAERLRPRSRSSVTKEVVLDIEGPSFPAKDPMGNPHMGASATTKINRSDFGVSAMPGMIGDEVAIVIDVELVKQLGPPS